jgi:hypothetical protein
LAGLNGAWLYQRPLRKGSMSWSHLCRDSQ